MNEPTERANAPPALTTTTCLEVEMAGGRVCAVPDCGKKYHAHGYCARHAAKFRAYGDPLAGRTGPSPGEPLQWIRGHATYQGDDCIRWPFEVGRYGYGVVKHNGKKRVASRVMCEIAHGDPPSDEHEAAHSCGNGHRACMNPRHLRWATRAENVQDTVLHGTFGRGQMKKSKFGLTPARVRAVRAAIGTAPYADIAQRFGISETVVGKIARGESWKWVA